MDDLIKLIGKEVIVEADGIIYRGELIEVTEEETYLKSETGWITIPMEKISSIRGT
jgi:hypothetical protein